MRQILTLLFLMCLFSTHLVWVFPVHAADFTFDYDVYYEVAATGLTHVRQEITLTNEVTDFYASNYTLAVVSENLQNITTSDAFGAIVPQVKQENGLTLITVVFNQPVVGRGKQLPFKIAFESGDIAEKRGRIWEIIIPGLERKDEVKSYQVHLQVPPGFGQAAYSFPQPNSQGVWTLAELQDGGVRVGFGEVQNFSFNLEYFLENPGSKKETQEITLPPDTAFQKIVLSRLSPRPQNVRIDTDGNWLASYELSPQANLKVVAEGHALIYLTARSVGRVVLSDTERQLYTRAQPFWEQTAEIKAKAAQLKTAENIYNWVVDILDYDYGRVERGIKRLGARVALANTAKAACMEFSDLFVAAARAAGIPAREIHGYAYTTNSRLQPLSLVSDVLHAWAEYYDEEKGIWVPVDPTWGDTTRGVDYFHQLDFNHVALAILGKDSDYPYPAGSFKTFDSGKDVFVNFTTEEIPFPQPGFAAEVKEGQILAGVKNQARMIIRNTGEVRLHTGEIAATGIPNTRIEIKEIEVAPFGEIEVPMEFSPPFIWWARVYPLTIRIAGQQFSDMVTVYPFYQLYAWQIVAATALLTIGGIIIRRGKSRFRLKY